MSLPLKAFWSSVIVLSVLLTVACNPKKDDNTKSRPATAATTEITVNSQKHSVTLDTNNVTVNGKKVTTTLTIKNEVTKKTDVVNLTTDHSVSLDYINFAQAGAVTVVFQARCSDEACSKYYLVAWSGDNTGTKFAANAMLKGFGTDSESFSTVVTEPMLDRDDSRLSFENLIRKLDVTIATASEQTI